MGFDDVRRDVVLAIRRAGRRKTFSLVVAACVALGVGAMAAVHSVLAPVLLRPVPFEEPERLVRIAAFNTNRTDPAERFWVSWLETEPLFRSHDSLEGLAGFIEVEFDVLGPDGPERIHGARTLPGSFDALRVRPVLGRTLRVDDMERGVRAALLGEELWTRRYARDPEVLGRTVTLDERPYEIVGIVPAGHRFPGRSEIWASYHPDDYSPSELRGTGNLQLTGRLARGSTDAELDRDLADATRAFKEGDPVFFEPWGLEWISLREGLVGNLQRPLWTLFAGAALVLLLALANVVNLLLARAQGETWERAIHAALGAPRGTLFRQRALENALLTVTGAAAGTLLAVSATRALLAVTPLGDPAFDRVGLSTPVVLASAALAGLIALTMSLVSVRGVAISALRGKGTSSAGPAERRTQTAFVVGQVALSLVLLIGAGLFWRSFANLQALDLGIETAPLVAIRVSAPVSWTDAQGGAAAFTSEVLARAAAIPGVEATGASSGVPFDDPNVGYNHSVEDFPPEDGSQPSLAPGWVVTPGWFASMGIPLASGRDFLASDLMDAPPVGIVNREFERRYWPGGSALGKRIKRGAYHLDRPWIEIVGVVEDHRSGTLADAVRPNLYYPMAQSQGAYLSQMAYTVRYGGDPSRVVPALRAAVADVSPAATVYRVSTGEDIARVALGRPRFNGLIIATFALVGLALAIAGVYGVTTYTVSRRIREFGLRVALGASPGQVRVLVLRRAAWVAATGAALGLIATTGLTRALGGLLFEVDPFDVPTYAGVTFVLVGVVLASSYLPARRATAVDPTVALREE